MSRDVELAAAYQRARPRLVRVAYAVLGSVAGAEDVVSDCWLRPMEADARELVRDLDAWATVAVAPRALDVLRSARARRLAYVGPWLPEPLRDPDTSALTADPADRVTLDETVSFTRAAARSPAGVKLASRRSWTRPTLHLSDAIHVLAPPFSTPLRASSERCSTAGIRGLGLA